MTSADQEKTRPIQCDGKMQRGHIRQLRKDDKIDTTVKGKDSDFTNRTFLREKILVRLI